MNKTKTCLFITLLLLTVGFTSIPFAQSETQDIKILSYNYYVDSFGILDVAGEIQNVGSSTIDYVYLAGTVYSKDGTNQGSATCRAWVSYLTPQQKAPFYMDFRNPSAASDWFSVDISKVTLEVSQANPVNSHQYPDLKITSSEAKVSTDAEDSGTYWVSGTIQNTGSQTASQLTVVGIFYDSAGKVLAVGYTEYLTPASLSPSGTTQFKVGAFDANQSLVSSDKKISSYSLLVQAASPIIDGEGPAASSPTATQDGGSNNSFDSNLLYVIIIAGVVIAVVAALLVSRRR